MTLGQWIGLGILLAVLLLLLLRVGVLLEYEEQLRLTLCIGPWRKPLKKKEEAAKEESAPAAEEGTQTAAKKKPVITKELVFELLASLKKLLFMIGKRLHIIPLEVQIVFGGPDPADVARAFGQSNAALWPLLALLEENMTVRRRKVCLDMDFTAEKSVCRVKAGVSMHVFDWLAVLIVAAYKGLKLLLHYRKLQPKPETTQTNEAPQSSEA